MADASNLYAIRALPVTSTAWTPIVIPIACNTWAIQADADILLRSDQADPGTQVMLKAGTQQVVTSSRGQSGVRFPAGQTILFAQAVSGSTTVHGQFSA